MTPTTPGRHWRAGWVVTLTLGSVWLAVAHSGSARAAGNPPSAPRARVLVMSTPPEQKQDHMAEELAAGLAAAGETAEVVPVAWPADATGDADVARHLLSHAPANLVVGVSLELAKEMQRQAPDLPLLFDAFNDPRRNCVVQSLDTPGKNATGTFVLGQEGEKMADVLLSAFPALRQVVFLVTDEELGQQPCPKEFEPRPPDHRCRSGWVDDPREQHRLAMPPNAADWVRTGAPLSFRFWRVCSVPDIVGLGALARQPQTGVVVLMRDLFHFNRELLVKTLHATRKPAVYLGARFVEAGGLMALAPKLADPTATTLRMTRLILHGRQPATLPVSTPRSNTIVFNRAAARSAGLVPSVSFLRRVESLVEAAPAAPETLAPPSRQVAGRATPSPR